MKLHLTSFALCKVCRIKAGVACPSVCVRARHWNWSHTLTGAASFPAGVDGTRRLSCAVMDAAAGSLQPQRGRSSR